MKNIDITFDSLEQQGYESVTDFCRYLVSTGGKFQNVEVHVYRGEMLCLIVKDVYEAAKLRPTGTGWRMDERKASLRLLEAAGAI